MNSDNAGATEIRHLKGNIRALSIRGGVITLASQGVLAIVQIASVIFLARLLPPQSFGLVAIAASISALLSTFSELGLSQAVIQRDDLTDQQLSTLFWTSCVASSVLALMLAAVAPGLAYVFGLHELQPILYVLALQLVVAGISTQHRALLTRQMHLGRLRAIEVASALLTFSLSIALAVGGYGFWSIVLAPLAATMFSSVALWYVTPWRPMIPRVAHGSAPLLSFGANVTLANALNYFARHGDNLLVGWAWGPHALGLYTRAYTLVSAPLQHINAPLSLVAVPALSRLANDSDAYLKAYFQITEKILLLSMPAAGILIVAPDLVVEVLFGREWRQAGPIVFWFGVAVAYQPLSNTTGWLFISQGRASELRNWSAASVPITLLSFLAGLPFGPASVAASYVVIGAIVRLPLLLWYLGRKGPVKSRHLLRLLADFGMLCLAAALGACIARMFQPAATAPLELAWVSFCAASSTAVAASLARRTRRAALETLRILSFNML